MEEYQNWAKSCLLMNLLEDLKIHELGDGERGVYCQNNSISKNSILLTIPFTSLLTIQSAINTPLESITSVWREDDILAILLLYEKYIRQDKSKWYLHIQYLPTSYHNTVNFTDDELELIKGSNLYHTTHQWKLQIRSDYQSIIEKVQELFQNIGGCEWLTFETYLWALCTIWSRFVSIRRGDTMYRSMVPYFDMLNHSPTSPVGHIYLPESDSLALVTSETLDCQHEITLNYGELSNTKLMMLYGFCLLDNPFDAVDLYLTALPTDLPEYQFKKDLLTLWGINETSPFQIKKNSNKSGISKELVYYLRVQYGDWGMNNEDEDEEEDDDDEDEEEGCELSSEEEELITKYLLSLDHQLSVSQRRRKERRYRLLCRMRYGPASLGNEMIISQLLLPSLTNMLHSYATTITQDLNLLQDMGVMNQRNENSPSGPSPIIILYPSEREKNSVLMRYSEKIVLQNAIEWITGHMTNLLSK